jgi:hypothetical protein
VLTVIEVEVAAVLPEEDLGTAERARTITSLAGMALRAIESANIVARVEALERALEARRAAQ